MLPRPSDTVFLSGFDTVFSIAAAALDDLTAAAGAALLAGVREVKTMLPKTNSVPKNFPFEYALPLNILKLISS
jgi:hypothetical protein